MSLYANINVSKAQEEAAAIKSPLAKTSKSAALYAAVLATPPPTRESVPVQETPVREDIRQPVEVEPEKPTEASALQFKPTIRRIQKINKPRNTSLPSSTEHPTGPAQPSPSKSYLQDVSKIQEDIANDDVNGFYRTIEGQRLARKNNRKKKRKNNEGTYTWTWDDEYDPTHPNDYETYIDSDEQLREQIEWKRKLEGKDEFEEEEPEEESGYRGFAPPEEYEERERESPVDDGEEYIPEPVAAIELDETGDDVYARRMRMAREAGIDIRPLSPPSAKVEEDAQEYDEEEIEEENRGLGSKERSGRLSLSPRPKVSPPEHPNRTNVSATIQYPKFTSSYPQPPSFYETAPGKQPPQPPIPSSTISSEPIHYSTATISSDPVFYETSIASSSDPVFYNTPSTASKDPGPRTNLPGQKDFASRLMSKYGWQKGQSLGSTPSSGLVTPLVMKSDKDRKGTGIILNRNKIVEDHGPFGKMTRCIVLANVVGLGEVDEELVDEIGSECREKYGEVERIRVIEDPRQGKEDEMVRVFVLFTSELSALRGVNALNGRLFGGRTIKTRFYDVDKFEGGDFR